MIKRTPCFLFRDSKINYRIHRSPPVDPILSHLKHTDPVERISCTLKTIIMATLPIFRFMHDNLNPTEIRTVWNYTWKLIYESDFARPFITVFTRIRKGKIPWVRLLQFKSSLSLLRCILVLSSHVCLDLASRNFPRGFHPNLSYAFHSSPIRIIFPVHDTILDLMPY
jgi:hypothetical protein